MSIDPNTLEKIKKACSPQKAIYEVADFVSTDILPHIENATNTANAALGQVNSAYNRATEALNGVSRMEQQVEDSVIELTDRVNASTVTIVGNKNSGASTEVILPVSSRLQAGVMNSATYATLDELGNRVSALESNTVTYLVTLPNDNPTQAEINSAYQTAYPTAPFPPNDGTTVIDQGKQLFYRYVKNGNLWIKTSGFTISQWTNNTLGTVKGSTTPGQIQAETDGTGSLVGYDAIISNISTAEDNINALTTRVSNAESSVTSLTTQVDANTEGIAYNRARVIERLHAAGGSTDGVLLSIINPDDVLVNDVIIPVVNSATSGVITPAMYKQWNSGGNGGSIISTATANFTDTLELVTPEEWEFTLKINTNRDIVLTSKPGMSLLVYYSSQGGSDWFEAGVTPVAYSSDLYLGSIVDQPATCTYFDIKAISLTNSKVRHIGIVSDGGGAVTTVRVLNLV